MHVPQPGELFEGKYEIVRRLGAGGFANVFLALDREIQREVAIKVLTPDDNGYRHGVEARFMIEARILATLQDPHIIRLFTYGQTQDGLLYMVFQYVAGTDLSVLLSERGALPEPIAVHIAMQVLEALTEAHAAGVLHRDLKPANVLVYQHLGDDFAVKLLDFGIAKVDPKAGGVNLTKTGAVVGTPRYMAPEQVFGEPFNASADVYSVGLVLFEMLTGRPAVEGDQQAIIRHHITEAEHVVPPVARRGVVNTLERMLAREPVDRIQTAQEARVALQRAMADVPRSGPVQPPIHSPTSSPTAAPPTIEEVPNKGRAVVVFFVSALVAAIAGVGVWYSGKPKPKEEKPTRPVDVPENLLQVSPPKRTVPEMPPVAEAVDAQEPDAGQDLARPVEQDLGPEPSGCGGIPQKPGEMAINVGYGRTATVLVPKGCDPNQETPLVIGFHPKLISESKYLGDADFDRVVRSRKYIVVGIPAQDMINPWDSAEDMEVVEQSIAKVKQQFCIDEQRLYVAGHAEGAEMARRYVCDRPASALVITGWVMPVGDTWCIDGSQPPIPTLSVMGHKDEYIPKLGGYGCANGPWMSHEMFTGAMRTVNRCRNEPKESMTESKMKCTLYDNCELAPFETCTTIGGHNLDRSGVYMVANLGCNRTALGFDMEYAFDFFETHGVELPSREKLPVKEPKP